MIPIFATHDESPRPYEFTDNVHFAISYEMDLDKYFIERTVYTSLDLLGDIGGLMGILITIGNFIYKLIQGNGRAIMMI